MLITTSAVALAAVALLGATLGLPALVADPDEAAIQAPAAAGVGDDWAFFSGTLRFDGTNDGYAEVQAINGLTVQTGEAWVDQTLTASDPRMTGTRAEVDNTYQNLSGENGGSSGAIWASMVTIEADGGRWSCQLDGLSVGSSSSESGWCEGLDGFAGLRAFVAFDIGDASGNDQIDVSGYITDGDGPPVPAPTTD